ncbi:ABC transporter permease [Dactylosporangium sp. AC04546]|uniref:ABC transporter permease n=1 Tax=Dactylosporangium sp. AC04546 TaxID=2862460 RepID=UPI001EE04C3E|nr:ABC transporter permease [Dactylosporangium sp. AC04546]WVK86941.1 ABC transporter permease [Dactylosporangium sp. AC04546]
MTETAHSTKLYDLAPSPERPAAERPVARKPVRRKRRIALWLAVGWLGLTIVAALAADLLPIADPSKDVGGSRLEPFRQWPEFLGTDGLGRSQLSRAIFGARVSLAVGIASACVGMLLGGSVGVLAGYFRRRFDALVGIVTDSFLAFPALVLLIALSAILEPSVTTLVVGLSLISFPTFVRLTRANTMRFVNREFVTAARAIGTKPRKIILNELVPNVVPPVAAYLPLVAATLIIAEASLSYLGLGIRPPVPSWGTMIADGQSSLRDHFHLVAVPAALLFLTVYSINVVGEWLRSRFDISASKL